MLRLYRWLHRRRQHLQRQFAETLPLFPRRNDRHPGKPACRVQRGLDVRRDRDICFQSERSDAAGQVARHPGRRPEEVLQALGVEQHGVGGGIFHARRKRPRRVKQRRVRRRNTTSAASACIRLMPGASPSSRAAALTASTSSSGGVPSSSATAQTRKSGSARNAASSANSGT